MKRDSLVAKTLFEIRYLFKPWQYNVIRFVGTERQNSDYLVDFMRKNRVKPVSYSCTLVEKRYIGVLIYKEKKIK